MIKKFYVKLIIGVIYADTFSFVKAKSLMQSEKWEIQNQSQEFPFDQTNYYLKEMGDRLKRCFLSVKGLKSLEFSSDWKSKTVEIEKQFIINGKRRINLDPGYLDMSRVVLLSGKEGSHKIYLRNNVWADLVLLKDKSGYRNLPWTFPDIRTGRYNDFFLQQRAKFKKEKLKFELMF